MSANLIVRNNLRLDLLAQMAGSLRLSLGVDLSSSMHQQQHTLPDNFGEFVDALCLAPEGKVEVTLYEVAGEADPEDPRSGVRQVCRHATPQSVPRYTAEDLVSFRQGGKLIGGSPLLTGLGHLADRALTDRLVERHVGPELVALLADGWDTTSCIQAVDLRRKLDACRANQIMIRVIFFVPRRVRHLIDQFIEFAQLRSDEYTILSFENEAGESQRALGNAFEELSQSVSEATQRF